MQQTTLKGKTALVTGGTSGLGKSIAIGLARLGATVVVTGRDRARGEQALAEIQAASSGGRAEFLQGDLLTQVGVRATAADFSSRHGALHILPMGTYNTTRVAGLYVGYELARRLKSEPITLNAVDPGGVRTELFKSAPVAWYMKPLMSLVWIFVAKPPEVAARAFIEVAASPKYEGITGKYFSNMKERRSAKNTYDQTLERRVFDACVQIAHVSTAALST